VTTSVGERVPGKVDRRRPPASTDDLNDALSRVRVFLWSFGMVVGVCWGGAAGAKRARTLVTLGAGSGPQAVSGLSCLASRFESRYRKPYSRFFVLWSERGPAPPQRMLVFSERLPPQGLRAVYFSAQMNPAISVATRWWRRFSLAGF